MYNKAKYEALSSLSYGEHTTANRFVLLLHGYGSDSKDLIEIAPLFENIKNTLFIAPNAPYDCDTGFGRQWFPLVNTDGDVSIPNVNDIKIAFNILTQLIEEIIYYHDIKEEQLNIFGFSQGGVLALHSALNSSLTFGSIICHSGLYYDDGNTKNYNNKQKILAVHGDLDNVITLEKFNNSINNLKTHNIDLQTHIEKGLSHGVNKNTIGITEKFLNK